MIEPNSETNLLMEVDQEDAEASSEDDDEVEEVDQTAEKVDQISLSKNKKIKEEESEGRKFGNFC